MIAFFIIAVLTCAHKIIPRISAAARFRDYVVNSQFMSLYAAILAAIIIAPQNIPSREFDFLVWHSDIAGKTYNARMG